MKEQSSKKRLVLSVVSVLVVLALLAGATMAWFTDTEKVNANFEAGVLDISISGNGETNADLTFQNMRPLTLAQFDAELVYDAATGAIRNANTEGFVGEPVYFQQITVKNEGTLPAKLQLGVIAGAIPADCEEANMVDNGNGGMMVGDPATVACTNGLADVVEVYLYKLVDGKYVRVEDVDLADANYEIAQLSAGEEISYVVGARVPETAGNQYQGKHYHAQLVVNAAQIDDVSAFAA